MYACMYASMYLYMYACKHACVYACTRTPLNITQTLTYMQCARRNTTSTIPWNTLFLSTQWTQATTKCTLCTHTHAFHANTNTHAHALGNTIVHNPMLDEHNRKTQLSHALRRNPTNGCSHCKHADPKTTYAACLELWTQHSNEK